MAAATPMSAVSPGAFSTAAAVNFTGYILPAAEAIAKDGVVDILELRGSLVDDAGACGLKRDFFEWLCLGQRRMGVHGMFLSLAEVREATTIFLAEMRAKEGQGSEKSVAVSSKATLLFSPVAPPSPNRAPRSPDVGRGSPRFSRSSHSFHSLQTPCSPRSPNTATVASVTPSTTGSARPFKPRVRCFGSASAALQSVPFLVKWINYLCGVNLGWTPLTSESFFEDLKTGIVLCRIVERLSPGSDFSTGIYSKPRVRYTCIQNIEAALHVVWKAGVNSHRMCSAEDFYSGNVRKVTDCMLEIFDALQMRIREVRLKAQYAIRGMHAVLSKDGLPLSEQTVSDPTGFSDNLLEDFADGNRIVKLLIAAGKIPAASSSQLRGCCVLQEQWEDNAVSTCRLLKGAGCPVFLAPSEWIHPPKPFPDTLIFQLYVIWQFLARHVEEDLPGQFVEDSTEAQVCYFFEFVLLAYASIDEVFAAMRPRHHARVSRSSFVSFLKSHNFSGDIGFIWHCLDKRSNGAVGVAEFTALYESVADRLHQADMGTRVSHVGSPSEYGVPSELSPMSPSDEAHSPEGSLPQSRRSVGLSEPGSPNELMEDVVEPDFVDAQLVVDFRIDQGHAWPGFELHDLTSSFACKQIRFSPPAEERAALHAEDERQQLMLYELGAVPIARQACVAVGIAAEAASRAAAKEDFVVVGGPESAVEDEGPAPTTSIEAFVVMSDKTEKRIWLQTSVVEVLGDDGTPVDEGESTELVLELRDPGEGDEPPLLRSQLRVRRILAVGQPPSLQADPSACVPYRVVLGQHCEMLPPDLADAGLRIRNHEGESLHPRDLRELGSGTLGTASHFHRGNEDGTHVLRVLPGPSSWRRREAAAFFEELSILARFLGTPDEENESDVEGVEHTAGNQQDASVALEDSAVQSEAASGTPG
eukprot:TRINITY_DN9626_c0_g1_i1.p1 TRINITY_DN9626_c0_g1~~TRINITY_DN9626_c0_g1_i1.p1  ORF type:complete len:945 (-),score=130.28 TRINITY_DN9626_c0_g1_i1:171-2945(-)